MGPRLKLPPIRARFHRSAWQSHASIFGVPDSKRPPSPAYLGPPISWRRIKPLWRACLALRSDANAATRDRWRRPLPATSLQHRSHPGSLRAHGTHAGEYSERFREQHGDKRIAALGQAHVERMVEARTATPGAALNFLVSLRALMRHAVTVGLRADDPTVGVRAPKYRPGGFYTWSEEDIAKFESQHPVGTRARLALALLLYTAQRRADVVRLGRQHLRDGVLSVRQQKTGTTLSIPLHPELWRVLDATPIGNLTFLTVHSGKPLSVDGFSGWFKRMCRQAGLPPRAAAHGLRKAACRRLAELGCSASIIASISGHSTLREVARYTAAADQARMARQAIEALTRTRTG